MELTAKVSDLFYLKTVDIGISEVYIVVFLVYFASFGLHNYQFGLFASNQVCVIIFALAVTAISDLKGDYL